MLGGPLKFERPWAYQRERKRRVVERTDVTDARTDVTEVRTDVRANVTDEVRADVRAHVTDVEEE